MFTTRRVFDWQDQQRFARASCDSNPIHMDATAARRTSSGAPIVHGIHSLLWLLDRFAAENIFSKRVRSLRVQFPQPIYVGDEATLEISEIAQQQVRAKISVRGEEVVSASLGFEPVRKPVTLPQGTAQSMSPPAAPREIAFEQMSGLNGTLQFADTHTQLQEMFPDAARMFGISRVAALAYSSCVVGMIVPGLHSMYSGLELELHDLPASQPPAALRYAVLSVTPRFRLVRIGVEAEGIRGSLETISRLPPTQQASMQRVADVVRAGEFSSSVALVIGGSRGLGELTAKMLAAGGASVYITYAAGNSDARHVADSIIAAGGRCSIGSYDVRRPAREQLEALQIVPTHVYYFATPPIFRRKSGLFDAQRFAEFNEFYVHGFSDLAHACVLGRTDGVRLFYPSSVAVDTRPATMTEYSMSKAAGEILCADLSKYLPGLQIVSYRLPRLPTDQTNSVVHAEAADPATVLLPLLRQMHG
jgi:hypothetical protein